MLLERNQTVIGIVFIVLLLAGTGYAVFASGGAFRPGMPLRAEFEDAAGLEKDDFVFVAGIRAGRVDSVEIVGDHVEVDFLLEAEQIPSDSSASIILQNTLGKRAIRIVPGVSSTPFSEGDVIPIERTSTPVDFPELGDETVDLLAESNVEALQDVVTAVADITEGQRQKVVQLLDGIERVTAVVAERREDLATVIDQTEVVVNAAEEKDTEIVTIIDEFGSTLDLLARRRDDVTRLLRETALTSDIAADLVEDRRAQIDRILDELHQDTAILDAHQVDLAHVFAYLPVGLEGFASVGYSGGEAREDNPSWGNVFTTNLGAIGIEAMLGCGGSLDQLLTELVGPDPQCDEDPEVDDDDGGSQRTDAAALLELRPRYGTLADFLGGGIAGVQVHPHAHAEVPS